MLYKLIADLVGSVAKILILAGTFIAIDFYLGLGITGHIVNSFWQIIVDIVMNRINPLYV